MAETRRDEVGLGQLDPLRLRVRQKPAPGSVRNVATEAAALTQRAQPAPNGMRGTTGKPRRLFDAAKLFYYVICHGFHGRKSSCENRNASSLNCEFHHSATPSRCDIESMSIIDDIRAALEAKRMTQSELARAAGIDEDKLSKSLNRKRRFQAEELDAIRRIVGLGEPAGSIEVSIDTLTARREFAMRLKRVRTSKGWTIERAARGLIEAKRLEDIEASRDDPTILELDIISGRLGVSCDFLVTGAMDATHPDVTIEQRREPGRTKRK